jgi:hypothetical protein
MASTETFVGLPEHWMELNVLVPRRNSDKKNTNKYSTKTCKLCWFRDWNPCLKAIETNCHAYYFGNRKHSSYEKHTKFLKVYSTLTLPFYEIYLLLPYKLSRTYGITLMNAQAKVNEKTIIKTDNEHIICS